MTSDQDAADASLELTDGEVLIRKGWANHFVSGTADGGSLHLTTRRLVFRAHQLNLARLSGSISLTDIVGIEAGKRFNQLTVQLAGGHSERFVVWHRNAWISDITAARASAART
jgi:hypothetical protein